MTKKDYQAIARAIHGSKPAPVTTMGRAEHIAPAQWRVDVDAIARVLAADNPRFDRATFVAACEDGNVTRRPKRNRPAVVSDLPPCVRAMRCYCAGHARGNPVSEPCDTRE